MELPHGIIVDERRGSMTILSILVDEMIRVKSNGYIRCERTPSEAMPRVGQLIIYNGALAAAIHESDVILHGLEALVEIEADSIELDCKLQSIEVKDVDRILELHPEAILYVENPEQNQQKEWWEEFSDRSNSWIKSSKLPTIDVSFDTPEFVKTRAASMVHKFAGKTEFLKPGCVYSSGSDELFTLVSNLKKHGRPVLVISRKTVDDLSINYDIPKNCCLWLSQRDIEGVLFVNLEDIRSTVNGFLEENKRAVLLLEGLEYLSTLCGPREVIDMLRDFSDKMRYEDDCLFISFEKNAWTTSQSAQILRAAPEIDLQTIITWNSDPEFLLEHPLMEAQSDEEQEKISNFLDHNTPELPIQPAEFEDEILEIELIANDENESKEFDSDTDELDTKIEPDYVEEVVETSEMKTSESQRGPRQALRIKRKKAIKQKTLTNRQINISQLSAISKDITIGELPKENMVPKVAIGRALDAKFSDNDKLNLTRKGGLSKNIIERSPPMLPQSSNTPRVVVAQTRKTKQTQPKIFDQVGSNIQVKKNKSLSQSAKVKQKVFDVDKKLESWKKELEEGL